MSLYYILCNGNMICVGVHFVVVNCVNVMSLFHCANGFGHVDSERMFCENFFAYD
jgi:hypothetical protein